MCFLPVKLLAPLFLLPWSRRSAWPCIQALARVWLGTLKVSRLKKVCSGSCLGSYCSIVPMSRHRELTWCVIIA